MNTPESGPDATLPWVWEVTAAAAVSGISSSSRISRRFELILHSFTAVPVAKVSDLALASARTISGA